MLKTRIITALALLAFFIPTLFYAPSIAWAVLMLGVTLFAAYEWGMLSGLNTKAATIFAGAYLILAATHIYVLHTDGFHVFSNSAFKLFAIVSIFWAIIVPIWIAFHYQMQNTVFKLLIGLCLITAFWMALVTFKYMNPLLLLMVASTIWLADSAAYFSGKQFGQNKLAETISPGKTWEGVAGAVVAVGVFATILKLTNMVDSWFILPALCLIAALGVYGDLFESLFKRQANMKDSGNLLPGHGGILDRVDGLIPAMPAAMMLLYAYQYYLASQI